MASFVFPKSSTDSYIRVYKIPVSTPFNKQFKGEGDFNYELTLPERVDNVVGLKLVDWSFPRDMIPTFWQQTTTLAGNNKLDFRLTNTDISATPGDFTAVMPTRYLDYQNAIDSTRDYKVTIGRLMNAAIAADPVWANRVFVNLVQDSQQRSLLIVSTTDTSLPAGSSTALTLRFASGPNAAESIWYTMGFNVQSDVTSSTTYYALPPGVQSLISPGAVRLRGSRYMDIFIDESSQKPGQRVFFAEAGYATNSIWSDGVFRFEFDQDNPPRTIEKLHIRVRYEDNTDPGRFLSGPILAPHYFTIHIFTLQDSIAPRPVYLKQNLSY